MKLPVKFIILVFAIIAGIVCLFNKSLGTGIAAGGAFIAYAAIEIYDLMIANREN
ncbi:MAG: hypothetical protein QM687_10640 [Ferruginibacter sp.]